MNFFKNKLSLKALLISSLVGVVGLTSCQSQPTKESDTFGKYEDHTLKISDLSAQEKSSLINAQKQLYETAQHVLENHYLDSWFTNYQIKNKLPTLSDAKKDYFLKNISVTDQSIAQFMKQNSKNKELLQIPESQRILTVKNYLTKVEQARVEGNILKSAYKENKLTLVAYQKPYEPVIQLGEGGHAYYPHLEKPQVTVVEFADYQCPFCVKAHPDIIKAVKAFPGKVQFIFRDFPLLDKHPQALPAALAAQCAENQGNYWGMHELIFNREPMEELKPEMYLAFAQKLNLDMTKFKACQNDPTQKESVIADLTEGLRIGVNETPTLFINGKKFDEYISQENLQSFIQTFIH